VIKKKYVELCKEKLNLTQEEAERTVNYLEALIVNVIKSEIKDYVEGNK
jgi:hypothetical protein